MALDPSGSSRIVSMLTLIVLVAAVAALVVLAIMVRYTDFIVTHPWRFVAEVVVLSFGSALPLFFAAYNRASAHSTAAWNYVLLSAKLAVFWVLMEISGVNSVLFSTPARPGTAAAAAAAAAAAG